MKVMRDTNDGFVIAEKGLRTKGSRRVSSGQSSMEYQIFKIANLFEDIPILKMVQDLSKKIEEEDPRIRVRKILKLLNFCPYTVSVFRNKSLSGGKICSFQMRFLQFL